MGQYSNDCPQRQKEEGNKPNPFQKGHVNHVNVKEVYDEPDAVIGTLMLNNFAALIIFYNGVSHSLISRVFVDRNRIPTKTINTPIRISSPGVTNKKVKQH
jgi:hypothetical protein